MPQSHPSHFYYCGDCFGTVASNSTLRLQWDCLGPQGNPKAIPLLLSGGLHWDCCQQFHIEIVMGLFAIAEQSQSSPIFIIVGIAMGLFKIWLNQLSHFSPSLFIGGIEMGFCAIGGSKCVHWAGFLSALSYQPSLFFLHSLSAQKVGLLLLRLHLPKEGLFRGRGVIFFPRKRGREEKGLFVIYSKCPDSAERRVSYLTPFFFPLF